MKKYIPPLNGVFLLKSSLCFCPKGLSINKKYLLWKKIKDIERTTNDKVNKIINSYYK